MRTEHEPRGAAEVNAVKSKKDKKFQTWPYTTFRGTRDIINGRATLLEENCDVNESGYSIRQFFLNPLK